MPKRKTIECLGLCGAGKSKLLKELVPALSRESNGFLAIWQTSEPPWRAATVDAAAILIKALLRDPAGIANFLRSSRNATLLMRRLGLRKAYLRRQSGDRPAFVLDGGLIQPLVSFAIETQEDEHKLPIDAILSAVPAPSVLIYIRADPMISLERYKHREQCAASRPRRHNFGKVDLVKRFQIGQRLCQDILAFYERRPGITVLQFDSESPLSMPSVDDLARRVVAVLGLDPAMGASSGRSTQ